MISFCLIVKDEEPWIEECLRNIEPLATEIIIADTGSTDRTMEICQSFGKVKLFQTPWENHFAKARNLTIEKAQQPWIFSFDADERIGSQDIPHFQRTIELADEDPHIEAINLVRRDYIFNPSVSGFQPCRQEYEEIERTYPGFYVEHMTRIFRNRPYIRWVGSLHEMIESTLQGSILKSDLVFHHYGYLPEELERKKKKNFYQEHGHRKIEENPHDWKAQYDLGIEYLSAQRYADCLPYFKKAIDLKGPAALILSNWGYALMMMGRLDEAVTRLQECIRLDPNSHDGHLNLGVSLMRKGKYLLASQILSHLIQMHPQSFMAFRNLGLCFAHLKDLERACAAFEMALKIFPQFVDAKLDLATLQLHRQNVAAAYDLIVKALKDDPQNARGQGLLQHLQQAGASTTRR